MQFLVGITALTIFLWTPIIKPEKSSDEALGVGFSGVGWRLPMVGTSLGWRECVGVLLAEESSTVNELDIEAGPFSNFCCIFSKEKIEYKTSIISYFKSYDFFSSVQTYW